MIHSEKIVTEHNKCTPEVDKILRNYYQCTPSIQYKSTSLFNSKHKTYKKPLPRWTTKQIWHSNHHRSTPMN